MRTGRNVWCLLNTVFRRLGMHLQLTSRTSLSLKKNNNCSLFRRGGGGGGGEGYLKVLLHHAIFPAPCIFTFTAWKTRHSRPQSLLSLLAGRAFWSSCPASGEPRERLRSWSAEFQSWRFVVLFEWTKLSELWMQKMIFCRYNYVFSRSSSRTRSFCDWKRWDQGKRISSTRNITRNMGGIFEICLSYY